MLKIKDDKRLYQIIEDENGNISFIPYDICLNSTILGRTIEEIITILTALDIEKELEIKMTMKNLKLITDKFLEDYKIHQQEMINQYIKFNFSEKSE